MGRMETATSATDERGRAGRMSRGLKGDEAGVGVGTGVGTEGERGADGGQAETYHTKHGSGVLS